MTKQRTYAAIILDKSGSMAGTQTQTIQGFNEHVQQFKENAKDQDIFVSLVTFNGEVFEHLWNEPADRLAEASTADYRPDGSTALRDAVGYTIDKLSETAQKGDNTSFLVIIISDGYENSSRHVSAEVLREKIQERQKRGNWTFTYMGCDESYLKQLSQDTAIPLSNMAAWNNKSAVRTRGGMNESRKKLAQYFTARSAGVRGMSACYHSVDEALCANYEDAGDDVDADIADAGVGAGSGQTIDPNVFTSVVSQPQEGLPLYGGAVNSSAWPVNPPVGDPANAQWVAGQDAQKEGTGYFAASKPVSWKA